MITRTTAAQLLANVGLALLLGAATASAAESGRWPLWGELSPGPHRVGYRVIAAYDPSRTGRTTRPYEQPFSADLHGRPVRICLWYPATAGGRAMVVDDYLRADLPPQFAEFAALTEAHDRADAMDGLQPADAQALLHATVAASASAPAAPGRFPLLVYSGGMNAVVLSNPVLAEYLASYGYVVAAVTALGANQDQPQAFTATDIEMAARDLEFGGAIARAQPFVDAERLALMGHSYGSVLSLVVALRNENVRAVVGLDGTHGFNPRMSDTVVTARAVLRQYDTNQMRAAFLDLRRQLGEADGLKLDVSRSFRFAERYLVLMDRIRHSDFRTSAMINDRYHAPEPPNPQPGFTRAVAAKRHQQACQLVRHFLDGAVKGDSNALRELRADADRFGGITIEALPALPAPPSPKTLVTLMHEHGFAAATATVARYRALAADVDIVNETRFNDLGYVLLADKRPDDAINALRLAAYAHPMSANLQDSLGDIYDGAGKKADARAAFNRVIELVPKDPTLNDASRKELTERARRYLSSGN